MDAGPRSMSASSAAESTRAPSRPSVVLVPHGSNPNELKGCRGILFGLIFGIGIWAAMIGAIIWLAT